MDLGFGVEGFRGLGFRGFWLLYTRSPLVICICPVTLRHYMPLFHSLSYTMQAQGSKKLLSDS